MPYSYKIFSQQFNNLNQNFLNIENQLQEKGIKLKIFKLSKFEIQSIKLMQPCIFLQSEATQHANVLYKKNFRNFKCFCPTKGYIQYSIQEFLNVSNQIFIQIEKFNFNTFKSKIFVKKISTPISPKNLFHGLIWKITLWSIFLVSRFVLDSPSALHNLFVLLLLFTLTIILALNIWKKYFKYNEFNNFNNTLLAIIIIFINLVLNYSTINYLLLLFIAIFYGLVCKKQIIYSKQIFVFLFVFINLFDNFAINNLIANLMILYSLLIFIDFIVLKQWIYLYQYWHYLKK